MNDLELPTPPSVVEAERAYDNPTAELSTATAKMLVPHIVEQLRQLDDLGELGPAIEALVRFDRDVTTSEVEDGPVVVIHGAPLRTDAVVTIWADCPGWSGEEDDGPVRDAVELTVVVRESELIPVAWGDISGCRLETSPRGMLLRVAFSAAVIAYLPTILDRGDGPRIVYVAFELTELEINGEAVRPWSGDFRLVGDLIEIRIDIANEGHVIGFVAQDASVIGIRAANGEWRCYPGERRCERSESPVDSFSY